VSCVRPFPDAPVFAFDPAPEAGELCAAANVEVAGRGSIVIPDAALSQMVDLGRARAGLGVGSGPFWARVRANATRSADADSYIGIAGEAWVPAFDHAALGGTALGFSGEFGLVPDPWVLAGNRSWGLDALAPTTAEALGLVAPSDAGFAARWTGLDGRLDVTGTLTTGEGAKFRERNEGKDLTGALSVAPFANAALVATVYGRNGSRGLGYVPAHRVGARVAGTVERYRYGLEGMGAWGVGDDATRTPSVGSAWIHVSPLVPLLVVARADAWSEDSSRADALAWRALGGAGVTVRVPGGAFTAMLGADHAAAGAAQNGNDPLDTGSDDTGKALSTSATPGQIVVSEVMFDPGMVDGDYGEWFEVHNVSDTEVDLAGIVVQDSGGTGFAVDGALLVPAGGHLVFGASADTSLNGGVPVDHAYSIDAVKLGNEGDTLTLVAGDETLDSFTWDEAAFSVAEGATLQLTPSVDNPAGNDTPDVWCLATASYGDGDLGTPGAANTACE
jgi:hypothetical protein